MQVQRSDLSPRAGRETLHRITGAVLSLTEQGRDLRVLPARAHSVVCGFVRVAFLSRLSLDQRAYERPDDNIDRGTSNPGRSSDPGPLLGTDTEAGIYLWGSRGIPLAGWPQRPATTPRGRRLLSSGACRDVASLAHEAKGETDAGAASEGGRRPAQRCTNRNYLGRRGVSGGRTGDCRIDVRGRRWAFSWLCATDRGRARPCSESLCDRPCGAESEGHGRDRRGGLRCRLACRRVQR